MKIGDQVSIIVGDQIVDAKIMARRKMLWWDQWLCIYGQTRLSGVNITNRVKWVTTNNLYSGRNKE